MTNKKKEAEVQELDKQIGLLKKLARKTCKMCGWRLPRYQHRNILRGDYLYHKGAIHKCTSCDRLLPVERIICDAENEYKKIEKLKYKKGELIESMKTIWDKGYYRWGTWEWRG